MSELVETALRLFLRSQRKLPTFRSGGTLVEIAERDPLYRATEVANCSRSTRMCWFTPPMPIHIALPRRLQSADEIRALRRARVSAADAKKVGDARRVYEAELRSGWDSYRGAIEAAHGRNVARLVDCLRARKPLADGDGDRLAAFIATKLRRRRWPPEVARSLGSAAPTEAEFDLLADFVEKIGRRPGGDRDQSLHRASRFAEVLLSLLGPRVPAAMRTAVIKYACETEGDDSGLAIEPERVRDLLNRPRARRQY
jgi:hypothetical protein